MGQPAHKRAVGVDYIAAKTGYTTSTIYRWMQAGFVPPPNPKRANAKRTVWAKGVIDKWLNTKFDL